MIVKKDTSKFKYLYHYTRKENIDNIMSSKEIHSADQYVFFTDSLEKAIGLFERDMMRDTLYYDLDLKLKRRIPAKKEDYRIVKIAYKNDGDFYRFIFPGNTDEDNVYNVSKIHKGTLKFKKAEVLSFDKPTYECYNVFSKGFVIKLASLALLFTPLTARASTWLDEGNYDISWFNEDTYNTTTSYTLTNAEEVAGLGYLVNVDNYTFANKSIVFRFNSACTNPNDGDCVLDMTDHDWVPLKDSFQGIIDTRRKINGTVCGWHRLLIAQSSLQLNNFKETNTNCKMYDHLPNVNQVININCGFIGEVRYIYNVNIETPTNGSLTVNKPRAVYQDKIIVTAIPDRGYAVDKVTIQQADLNPNMIFTLNPDSDQENVYSFDLANTNYTVRATFKKVLFNITIEQNRSTVTAEESLEVQQHDSRTFNVVPEEGYEVKGYRINKGMKHSIVGNSFTIEDIQEDMEITIITEPIQYHIIEGNNQELDIADPGDLVARIDTDTEMITKIELCDDKCIVLGAFTEYELAGDTIIIKDSYLKELSLEGKDFKITFNNDTTLVLSATLFSAVEEEKTLNNPNTKVFTSIIFVIMGILSLGLIVKFKDKMKKY